jgi:hypothetical protein
MPTTRSKVASASKRTSTKRVAAVLNEPIVANYLEQLEASLGDSQVFPTLFERLSQDSDVRQLEAVAIATRFVAKTSDSTSRAKALERVWKRHAALASFKLKQRAMAGRSAA